MELIMEKASWARGFEALGQRWRRALQVVGFATPVLDLAIRIWVGMVFFNSGMVKIASWQSTLSLFENEYNVPLLPPHLAAYMGTGVELIMPIFLVLGLGGRLAAFVLFIFNIIAVVSYPDLSEVGLKDHQYWGLMLLVTMLHGPGKLSVDHFIREKLLSWGGQEKTSSW